jgi:hypothetical protein
LIALHFDELLPSLAFAPSRRHLLAMLSGGLLAMRALVAGVGDANARKGKRNSKTAAVVAGTRYALVLTRSGSGVLAWLGHFGDTCAGQAFRRSHLHDVCPTLTIIARDLLGRQNEPWIRTISLHCSTR